MSDPPDCSSGKRRFPTLAKAKERLAEILEQPLTLDKLYWPNGVHRCNKCHGFHLTSKPAKQWKTGKASHDLRCY
jgi:hypothetical protein